MQFTKCKIIPIFVCSSKIQRLKCIFMDELRYDIPPEKRAEKLKEVQQSEVYKFFLEEHRPEELPLLHGEIEEILNNGMPLEEFLTIGFKDDQIEYNDYRKIATFCFVETLMDFVDDVRRRTKDLYQNMDFNEVYQLTLNRIADYLHGVTSEFPREAVKCLFLLTDGDLDTHRQGLFAAHLMMDSFSFCKSEEQREEIEKLINECKL